MKRAEIEAKARNADAILKMKDQLNELGEALHKIEVLTKGSPCVAVYSIAVTALAKAVTALAKLEV